MQVNNFIESIGIIASIIFGAINLILYLRDKREERKPILYVVSQKNETTIKADSNIHIYGRLGINLGVAIYNIGNGLARDIKAQWLYEGQKIGEPICIDYLSEHIEGIDSKEIWLPANYIFKIEQYINVRKKYIEEEKTDLLLDGVKPIELKISFCDAGTKKYTNKYSIRVKPSIIICGEYFERELLFNLKIDKND